MTLLRIETFDLYADATALAAGGWTVVGTPQIETTNKLQGRAGLLLDVNERIRVAVAGTPQTCFVCFAFKWTGATPTRQVFRFSNVTTAGNTSLRLDADGHLGLFNATATQLGSSSVGTLSADTWYWIQIKATHADSLSEDDYIVWVAEEGGTFEEWINPTSGDSAFTGATVTEAEFICTTGNGSYYDSFALWTTAGSGTWSGALAEPYTAATLLPAGEGAANDWVGTDADSDDNHLHVDDTTHDSDTSYNESDTLGDVDLYALTAPADLGEPLAVQTVLVCRKTTSDDGAFQPILRSGGTNHDLGAEVNPAETYGWTQRVSEVDPDTTAAWTAGAIDALEIGVENTTAPAESTIRITQAAVEMLYLPATDSSSSASSSSSSSSSVSSSSQSESGGGIAVKFQSVDATDSVSTSSVFTIPGNAYWVELQASTQPVRYTMDGTTPEEDLGMILTVGAEPKLFAMDDFVRIKFIRGAETNGVLSAHFIPRGTES